jgi:hypothetical protein
MEVCIQNQVSKGSLVDEMNSAMVAGAHRLLLLVMGIGTATIAAVPRVCWTTPGARSFLSHRSAPKRLPTWQPPHSLSDDRVYYSFGSSIVLCHLQQGFQRPQLAGLVEQ